MHSRLSFFKSINSRVAFKSSTPIKRCFSAHHVESLKSPESFWDTQAKDIKWFHPYDKVLEDSKAPLYRWFPGGKMNTCYNCVDRHVAEGNGDRVAVIFDSPVLNVVEKYTYSRLHQDVTKFSLVLKQQGLAKGDRAVIYMPNSYEAIVAMLSCARLGAIHSVVFGGFSAIELATRIKDCKAKVVISTSGGLNGSRVVEYKPLLDAAITLCLPEHEVSKTVIWQRSALVTSSMVEGRDVDWMEAVNSIPDNMVSPCEPVDATDPLYVLYTSGTTGKPKGVVRDNGGHAVALKYAMRSIFDMKPGEVFFAASDVGWVVGHSFSVYGPLLQGCSTVIYEGKPIGTPDELNIWRTIERHRAKVFYTAPTAIRAIKRFDKSGANIHKFDLTSLQAVYLVGEHADADTIHYLEHGLNKPVIDNWWQTETGWPICSNAAGIEGYLPIKYGSCYKPIAGYNLQILDNQGQQLERGVMGNIVIKLPLPPGTLPTLYKNDERYIESYLTKFPGFYDTGDAGFVDEDGYVFVMSRTDDVINVSGHRLSTGAMEEVLSDHPDVAEAAVVGVKDSLKGQIPLGLVVLQMNPSKSEDIILRELVDLIREKIGPVADFKKAVVVPRLPKTRSGKVLRATMRQIANNEKKSVPPTIEDMSALDEVETIINLHKNDVILN